MVPALLTLRNFLCYRDNCPPVDFTGIHIACLTGENGNGKSALLDAMTWALWGQARARTDDELIHMGRTEMEIEFEFYAGEQRYRVIRKRRKGTQRSPGATSLEFHLSTPDGWKALSANHVRDTERRIRDILKLDYETFINSAFLVQGKADAFTVKTPGERKRILGEILGLSRYDDLERDARYEKGLRDDQVRSLEQELGELDRMLAQEPSFREERSRLGQSLDQNEQELRRATDLVETLRRAAQLVRLQRQQAEQAEKRWQEAEGEVDRAKSAVERFRKEALAYEAAVQDAEAIRAGYERLLTALAEERELGERLRQQVELERRRAELEAARERIRMEMVGEEKLLAAEAERVASSAAAGPELERIRTESSRRADALREGEQRLSDFRTEEQGAREMIAELRSANSGLREEMEGIKRKQTELSDVTVCPLCRTELGADGQAHVVQAYETEGSRLAAQFRENRAQMQGLEVRAKELHTGVEKLEPQLRQGREELARQLGALERRLQEATDAVQRLPELAADLERLRGRLIDGDYGPEQAFRLEALAKEIVALGYDAAAHTRARQTVAQHRRFEQKHGELELAGARLESARSSLESAEQTLHDWETRMAHAGIEVEALRASIAGQRDSSDQLDTAEAEHGRLLDTQRRLQLALGAIEQKLDDCLRAEHQRSGKQGALKQALQERRVYEELTAAFSRRGIQALIIDQVLPEITEEANRLIGRMTNNRLHVMMDTQRQTQKGDVTETLDIRISDELGTRNYELFSGGEAFRVNLALRIALSKLLARRAGAPLPTLVIDEGFGSQDAAALERLVEAINVIQSDFRCLLVITHLAELKDQFPVQIEVTRTADGSFASVIA